MLNQKSVCLCSIFFILVSSLLVAANLPSSMVSIGEGEEFLDSFVELEIGDQAPDFSLPNLATDKMEKLKDYIGKPLIIFFIQSACHSCLLEAKAFQELYEEYSGKINILAIGVDLLGKPMLITWASHNNITYPVLLDPIFSVPEKYGFSYTPSSVVLDNKGKIVMIHSGYRSSDIKLFKDKIDSLLK